MLVTFSVFYLIAMKYTDTALITYSSVVDLKICKTLCM